MSKYPNSLRANLGTMICTSFLLLAASGPVFAESYDIKLVRSLSVGDKNTIDVEVSYNVVRKGSPSDSTSDISLKFVATRHLDAVDPRCGPSRATYVVEEFSSIVDTKASTVLPKGATIIATAGDDGTTFDVDKTAPTPAMTKVLREVILMEPTDGSSTPDDVYGSRTPKSIDETWSNQGALISVIAKKHGFTVPADKIKGGMKLVSAEKVDNIDCIQIAGSVDADDIVPNDATGLKFSKFHCHMDATAFYPVEPTRDMIKSTLTMEFDKEFDLLGPDGKTTGHTTETIKKQRDIKISAVEK